MATSAIDDLYLIDPTWLVFTDYTCVFIALCLCYRVGHVHGSLNQPPMDFGYGKQPFIDEHSVELEYHLYYVYSCMFPIDNLS